LLYFNTLCISILTSSILAKSAIMSLLD
jgi:hypothetical protein